MRDPAFPHRHLLGIEGLSPLEINHLLDLSERYIDLNRGTGTIAETLRGRTTVNMFFENSTRTRTSFELAAKKLGANVINMQVESSSVAKGETLIDTAVTLNAMQPRRAGRAPSGFGGAVKLLADKVNCAVVNGGDGSHEHPTQALLDALTIRRRKGKLNGLLVAICGDVLHSRVARSNFLLLLTMGARVRIIAPRTLIPSQVERLGVEVFTDMAAGLKDVDIVMMLRVQNERMRGSFIPSVREYFRFFGLDRAKLAQAKPDALIMHPGPMNRGTEIDSDVADDYERSVIRLKQVELGVSRPHGYGAGSLGGQPRRAKQVRRQQRTAPLSSVSAPRTKVAYVNARLIDPARNRLRRPRRSADRRRSDPRRPWDHKLFDRAPPADAEVVDCGGFCLAPGLVDMRVQLREPGEEHKESLKSAGEAAVAGGVTTMACLPNTNPVMDDEATLEFVARRACVNMRA